MKYNWPIFFLLFTICYSAKGQTNFYAGTSAVSIEPDSSIFSVALAGYGAPREGRFSITWNFTNNTKNITSFTGLNGKLYAVTDNNELLVTEVANDKFNWKKLQEADNISYIASYNGKLLALKKDVLYYGNPVKGKINWVKFSEKPGIKTITSLNKKLYAINSSNELLEGTVAADKIIWKTLSKAANNIESLASYNNKLLALNSGDTLWAVQPTLPKPEWIETARYNGATVTINIRQIAVCGNKFYAVSANHNIYRAAHKTNGNLTARALAIKQNNKTIVIAGLDVTGFDASFINDIKSSIYKSRKIPAAAILINASHTHFAPVTQAWTTWGAFYHVPDSNYLNKIVKRAVIKSIEQALDNMTAVDLYFGRSSSEIGRNRRGSATNYKPYDSTLDVLKVVEKNKKIKSVIFLTACHPVFKNAGEEAYTLSANYPGVAKKIIEETEHIPHSIFIQGCAGDIDPKSDQHSKTGEQLATDVIKLLHSEMEKIEGGISFAADEIQIPVTPWSKDSVISFLKINAAKPGDLSAEKNVRWANLMLNRYEKGTVANTLPLYVQTLNVGNWKMVGLSREVVNEYGPAIRKLWPDKKVTVAGYCNDVASYLPIAWHITEKQYEGYDSFFWYGQPGIPSVNVLDFIIEKIKLFNR